MSDVEDGKTWEQIVRAPGTGRANRLMNDPTWKHAATACEGGADHHWQPVQMALETGGFQPDLVQGKVFVVCMACHSWSYIRAEWAGFYIASPDVERAEDADAAEARRRRQS